MKQLAQEGMTMVVVTHEMGFYKFVIIYITSILQYLTKYFKC